ncbi:MAG TPA: M1 family aminopeptidase [Burkholderiaceae bacterium]|jgi:alanyl aminopeptidase
MKFLFACVLSLFATRTPADPLPMRLGDDAQPQRYAVELRVDPEQPQFSGHVQIELKLKKPLTELRLHSRGLSVNHVLVRARGVNVHATVRPADEDSIWLRFDRPLPAGAVQLSLAFAGRTEDADAFGLFRLQEDKRWYAITQFEDVGARRAFPSFDDPGIKTPWTLTLIVPEGQQAFANMPLARNQPRRSIEKGWQRLRFQTTPPLPSYLVAFAVGPFDVLEGPNAGATQLRYLTAKGHGAEASYAANVTPAIIAGLEDYFGMPHPFPKIDSLALPMADGFGAMENVGLITYQRSWLQAPAGAPSGRFEREYTSVAAHEIAHQWFGNAVTLAWWNDLWLNESFASWMGDKITAQLHPEWHWELESMASARRRAMAADSLPGTRRVRQDVQTPEDLGTAFNAITYEKGEAVLSMFEAWLGPERMRNGVRRYLAAHAGGSARAEDFFAAMSQDQPELAGSMASFVEQAGIPQLDVQLRCEGKPQAVLQQRRYQPLGAHVEPQLWALPVSLRTPAGVTRVLMREQRMQVDLPDAQCPAWLQPNAGGMGYYRSAFRGALPDSSELSAQELLSQLDDRLSQAQSGELPLAEALPTIELLAARPERALREAAARALEDLQALLTAEQQPGYARLWARLFGLQAKALGWQAHVGEDADAREWRIALLPRMADAGQDADLRLLARALTQRWLSAAQIDAASHVELLDPGLRGAVLKSAALSGDAELFDALLALARRTHEPSLRDDLLAALMNFEAPELARRARELLLDEGLDPHAMSRPLLTSVYGSPARWTELLGFFAAHEPVLRTRLGEQGLTRWPEFLGTAVCGKDAAELLQKRFGAFAASVGGASSQLAGAVERLRLCGAYRDAQAASLAAYLRP